MKTEEGFSLIELLLVVAIILIIAAISVPNLLKSKMAANESSAAASLRTLATANVTYSSTYNVGYAGAIAQLGPTSAGCAASSSACADLIDSVLSGVNPVMAAPVKSGYVFTYIAPNAVPTAVTPNATFSVASTPVSFGSSGMSTFCLDQTNIVKKDSVGAAVAGTVAGCSGFAGIPM